MFGRNGSDFAPILDSNGGIRKMSIILGLKSGGRKKICVCSGTIAFHNTIAFRVFQKRRQEASKSLRKNPCRLSCTLHFLFLPSRSRLIGKFQATAVLVTCDKSNNFSAEGKGSAKRNPVATREEGRAKGFLNLRKFFWVLLHPYFLILFMNTQLN